MIITPYVYMYNINYIFSNLIIKVLVVSYVAMLQYNYLVKWLYSGKIAMHVHRITALYVMS